MGEDKNEPPDQPQQQQAPEEEEEEERGHLQMCVDARFVHPLMTKFHAATGLKPGQYWMHTEAGGTPKMGDSRTSPDYAYKNGARKMAWCAHGSFCGGYGGPDGGVLDDQIKADLRKMFYAKVGQYPKATHWAFFITNVGAPGTIWELGPLGPLDER